MPIDVRVGLTGHPTKSGKDQERRYKVGMSAFC